MLKADFHLHTKEDKEDNIAHSAKELIKLAAKQKFSVLSFTFHNYLFYPKDLSQFAKKHNITLIPGAELTIAGKHVLVHGIKTLPKITRLHDLEEIKDHTIITAPHPFFPTVNALGNQLIEHINLFDNIEYTARYNHLINFNRKAVSIAKKYSKPLLGNSDCHHLNYFGYTFTNIAADNNLNSIIDSLKSGKFKLEQSLSH